MKLIDRIKNILESKKRKKQKIKYLPVGITDFSQYLDKSDDIVKVLKELKLDEGFINHLDILRNIELKNLKGLIKFLLSLNCNLYEIRIIIEKKPNILIIDVEEIKTLAKVFAEFEEYIKEIIIKNPDILDRFYADDVNVNMNFLREYGLNKWEILNLIISNSSVLTMKLKQIKESLYLFEQVAINKVKVIDLINNYPYLFGSDDLEMIKKDIA